MTKKTYSVMEAAVILGISRTLMYRLVNLGEIPVIRLGKRMLIPHKSLDEVLNFKKEGC